MRIPYMDSALFVQGAVYFHIAHSHPCLRDKTSRTERLNRGNHHNRDLKEARKGGATSKTEADC